MGDKRGIRNRLRDLLIQILKKKFGIDVKQCETCESRTPPMGHAPIIFARCEYWTPKEVPDKK